MKLDQNREQEHKSNREFHSMLYRLVFSYTIFLTICLLLIIYLYRSSMKNSESEFWEQNKSVFQSSQTVMDNHLILIDSYCRQLIQDSTFTSTVLMNHEDQPNFYINAFKTKRSLSANLYSYPQLPIDFFYIYLKNYEHILSVNKFETAALFYQYSLKNYPLDYDNWNGAMKQCRSKGSFLVQKNAPEKQDLYTYMVDLSSLTYKDIPATICFHINPHKVREIFAGLPLDHSGYLLITDEYDQKILSFSDSQDANINPPYLSSLQYYGNYGDFKEGNETFFVTKLTSSFNNWNYYLVQPDSVCETSYHTYQIIFILFMIILAIVSIFIILKLSQKHMKPILLLNSRLIETITAHNELQEFVDFQKPYICASYLRQLMLGNISNTQESNYIQEYLQIPQQDLNFLVLYVMYYNTGDEHPEIPDTDLQEFVQACLLTEFKDYAIPHIYSPEERTCTLLLYSVKKPDEILISLQEKFFHLHETLLEKNSIWIFTGVGLFCTSLQQVWKSYQQAKDMISYSSKNYIFLLHEMKERDSLSFYYPEELSTKLTHFITSANKMQVSELIHLIHDENLKERNLPKHILNFLLSDIRNSLIKIRFSITPVDELTKKMLAETDSLFKEMLTFQLCETVALQLCDIFAQHGGSNDLTSSIIAYIKDNYNDPSLGLNKISDEFHISESYFSHLFKENTGINFSVYLEDIRLNEAVYRIRETDCNISDLYQEVGYNNANTFRRAFKKKFGVTPSTIKKSI